ncbi:MAG: hypothetical protein V3W14_01715 [Candidatus Neomarinimicrobiota bacterium]
MGEWRHFFPLNNARAILHDDGRIYSATGGGALVYDIAGNNYTLIGMEAGLVYPDIRSLALSNGQLWLGGAVPRGNLQIYNLADGTRDIIELDVEQITHILATPERGFVAFKKGPEVGIIDIRLQGDRFFYADIYRNLPGNVLTINDLDLDGDTLIVTTPAAVFAADVARDNLKDKKSWVRWAGDSLGVMTQYHIDSTGHWLLALNGIDTNGNPLDALLKRTPQGWRVTNRFNGSTVRHLARRSNGDFLVSLSNLLLFLRPDGPVIGTSRTSGQVLAAAVALDDQEYVYAIISRNGLSRYSLLKHTWESLAVNSMVDQSYSALLKLSSGELVGAGNGGITKFNGKSWYNLIPGFYPTYNPLGDRISGNYLVEQSPFYLADTLYFRGKSSWNMLELPSGELLVGFKGNPPAGGPLLRFSYDDIPAYIKYDTTGGALDGLFGNGYTTLRHMALDAQGNAWIALLAGRIHGYTLAVLTPDDEWVHFTRKESNYTLNETPTEIAFDNLGRVWVASEEIANANPRGGITVLDYGGTLDYKEDDTWYRPASRLATDESNTIWSMTFDTTGILWTLSPQGIMGWIVESGPSLRTSTNYGYFLAEIPFVQGSRIRVDAHNNKWISSVQDGLWVLLDNTTFWPSVEGFNVNNSPLPANEVLDIQLDDEEGLAYIATSKGISVLRIPFKEQVQDYSGLRIYPSPYRIPAVSPLVIDGLREGSEVKVFTVSGRLVRHIKAQQETIQGYQAFWDGKNRYGEWVGSGVYLVTAYLENGETGVGKVAVIRQR